VTVVEIFAFEVAIAEAAGASGLDGMLNEETEADSVAEEKKYGALMPPKQKLLASFSSSSFLSCSLQPA